MRQPIGHKKGLTLIEVLIAVAILGVSLLAIASMFPTSTRVINESGKQTRAFSLARWMAEQVLATSSFADIPLYNGQSTAQANFNTGSAVVDVNLTTWKETVEEVPAGGLPEGVGQITVMVTGAAPARLATVTVEVTWPNDRGLSAVLTTQVSET
ncbi:MAG: prepilin-type N-terminal cleavage/methylation domain-containing protein [Candidatus Methylomirabilales bacterium]